MKLLLLTLLLSSVGSLKLPSPTSSSTPTRRSFVSSSSAAVAAFTLLPSLPSYAATPKTCKAKANNCVTANLVAPSAGAASKDLAAVLGAYPQEGQDSSGLFVDGGGNEITASTSDQITMVFKSKGDGKFAKFFNGGKYEYLLTCCVEGSKKQTMLSSFDHQGMLLTQPLLPPPPSPP